MRGDVTKLPKWAQQEIDRLERDLADARARLAAGPEDSDTFADPYSAAPRPLGQGTLIAFHVNGGTIRVRNDGDCLDVNCDTLLSVDPRASNSVELKVRER